MDTLQLPRVGADRKRLAGLVFFALAAQFMTVVMLASSMAPAYDFGAGAISDLGVIPATALLFNRSLAAVGVLNSLGAYVLPAVRERVWLFALYVIAGVGAIGAAVFPLDRGGLHSIFALVAFLFFNLQAIGSGAVLRGPMRWLSVAAGVIGLVFVVVMFIGDGGNPAVFGAIGHGGAERMIVYPAMLWMLAFGGYLMREGGDPVA